MNPDASNVEGAPAVAVQRVVRERFPLQAYEIDRSLVTVPWTHAEEAYKEYSAKFGTSQSLERLAERHGFGVAEIVFLLVERIRRLEAKLPNTVSGTPSR